MRLEMKHLAGESDIGARMANLAGAGGVELRLQILAANPR
jgi:hypothetical protein